MKVYILGCGNSVGVPVIGCSCVVCNSCDPRNKRTRSSILLEIGSKKILIDATPDLRIQALKNDFHNLNAVFLTHIHFDHVVGIHELPSFLPGSYSYGAELPIYTDQETLDNIKSSASYLFASKKVGHAEWKRRYLDLKQISYYKDFCIAGESFFAFPQKHGGIICSGLIINKKIAYCTDTGGIPDEVLQKMQSLSLDLLIIECFTYQNTPSHTSFYQAVEYARTIKPKRALFTHMTHKIEYQSALEKLSELGLDNIAPAYDGLCIDL